MHAPVWPPCQFREVIENARAAAYLSRQAAYGRWQQSTNILKNCRVRPFHSKRLGSWFLMRVRTSLAQLQYRNRHGDYCCHRPDQRRHE